MKKQKLSQINMSYTFPVRSRCKICGSFPYWFYFTNKRIINNPNNLIKYFDERKKFHRRMCNNNYLTIPPKYFTKLSLFSHAPTYKGFSIRPYHSSGDGKISNKTEFLMCRCSSTSWAFTEHSITFRPEILNKRAKLRFKP